MCLGVLPEEDTDIKKVYYFTSDDKIIKASWDYFSFACLRREICPVSMHTH